MPGIFRDASLRYILFCFHGKVTVIWLYSLDFLKINTLMDRGGRNSGRELSLCLSMHHSIFKTMAQKAIWPCLWVTPPKLVERWNRLHWLSYYKMSTLPQAQLYSSLTWNSWISSSCQQVPSQVHCQSALYCISLPLSILLRVQKASSVPAPGSSQISKAKGFQIVLLEGNCGGCCTLQDCPTQDGLQGGISV